MASLCRDFPSPDCGLSCWEHLGLGPSLAPLCQGKSPDPCEPDHSGFVAMTTGSGMKNPSCPFLDWRVGTGQEDGAFLVLTLLPPAKRHGLGGEHLEDDSLSPHSWLGQS